MNIFLSTSTHMTSNNYIVDARLLNIDKPPSL
jgi:hypothetical protein